MLTFYSLQVWKVYNKLDTKLRENVESLYFRVHITDVKKLLFSRLLMSFVLSLVSINPVHTSKFHEEVIIHRYNRTNPYIKLMIRYYLSIIFKKSSPYLQREFKAKNPMKKLIIDNLNQVFTKKHYHCMLHSDQSFQHTTKLFKNTLEALGATIAHSNKENCYENACCENFFSQLKFE